MEFAGELGAAYAKKGIKKITILSTDPLPLESRLQDKVRATAKKPPSAALKGAPYEPGVRKETPQPWLKLNWVSQSTEVAFLGREARRR